MVLVAPTTTIARTTLTAAAWKFRAMMGNNEAPEFAGNVKRESLDSV
jgi:hypothetical protein